MKRFPTGRDLAVSGISEENTFIVSVVIQTILPRFILEAVFFEMREESVGIWFFVGHPFLDRLPAWLDEIHGDDVER